MKVHYRKYIFVLFCFAFVCCISVFMREKRQREKEKGELHPSTRNQHLRRRNSMLLFKSGCVRENHREEAAVEGAPYVCLQRSILNVGRNRQPPGFSSTDVEKYFGEVTASPQQIRRRLRLKAKKKKEQGEGTQDCKLQQRHGRSDTVEQER